MRIAYVLKKYPRLSETFILNEILGLEGAGVDVGIVSLYTPTEGRFHSDIARVRADVKYLPPFGSAPALDAFEFLGASPRACRSMPEAMEFASMLPREKRSKTIVHAVGLARYLVENDIDHIHAHFMTVASWNACLAHILTGVPFTVTAHAKDIFRTTVDRGLFRAVTRHASRIVTVSEFNRDFIAKHFLEGVGDKIARVYNGIPVEEMTCGTVDRESDLVLAVGRLVEKKGFRHLLSAVAALEAKGRRLRCVIVGDGDQREALERQSRELGLSEMVRFEGACDRAAVLDWMRRARMVVAPCVEGPDGNRDALPTVLIEALANGLPIVSTDFVGIPEIVEHESEGLLVPPGDTAALTAAIEQLIDDDAMWRSMTLKGPERARRLFDRDTTLKELIDVFRGDHESARERVA